MNHKATYKQNQNEYYTPECALEGLLNIVPKNYIIWESCCGERHISKFFEKHGYKVISTDIKTGQDFLTYEPIENYDIIITNPPFKNKDMFIKRCIELKKSFLLLLPISVFESVNRIKMFKENNVTLFLLPKKINYITTYKKEKSKSPFWSVWVGCLPNCEQNKIYYL